MTTRSRIISTVVTLWVATVAGLAWYYSQHPSMVAYDHAVRDTGNPFADRYLPTFPRADFAAAVAVATAVGLVVVLIAAVWTSSNNPTTNNIKEAS